MIEVSEIEQDLTRLVLGHEQDILQNFSLLLPANGLGGAPDSKEIAHARLYHRHDQCD